MGELKDWGTKNSKFISFNDSDEYVGVYEGYKLVTKDSFGEEKEVVRYKFDGKSFDSQSISLCEQMDDIKVGERVKLVRTGKGTDTKWLVERV